jgi:hypothetical protein
VDQGSDPRQEKAEKLAAVEAHRAQARRQALSVSEAWAQYIAARSPHWSDRHRFDHQNLARTGGEPAKRGNRRTTPGPLAPLLSTKLSDLTAARVREWLQDEASRRPTQTRLAFALLRVSALVR